MTRVIASIFAIFALRYGHVAAAPGADVIIVWAPGFDVAPLAAIASEHGLAFLDRSPSLGDAPAVDGMIQAGIDAFDALQLDAARSRFEAARRQLDATGDAGVTSTRLSDLFVYQALIRAQDGDAEGSWDELVAAVTVAPARVFDPARFPPRTLEALERARKTITSSSISIAIDAPTSCAISIDGAQTSGRQVTLLRGRHWMSASCPGAARWGRRIEVDESVRRIAVDSTPLVPPSEAELLVQARALGVRGLVVVEVRDPIAIVRLVRPDGRERARQTVAVTKQSTDAAAGAVRSLLAPQPQTRWYRSRWAWAVAGALTAAAILVPVAILRDDPPTGVRVIGPRGAP